LPLLPHLPAILSVPWSMQIVWRRSVPRLQWGKSPPQDDVTKKSRSYPRDYTVTLKFVEPPTTTSSSTGGMCPQITERAPRTNFQNFTFISHLLHFAPSGNFESAPDGSLETAATYRSQLRPRWESRNRHGQQLRNGWKPPPESTSNLPQRISRILPGEVRRIRHAGALRSSPSRPSRIPPSPRAKSPLVAPVSMVECSPLYYRFSCPCILCQIRPVFACSNVESAPGFESFQSELGPGRPGHTLVP
jgi:hypothetical protein